jgi:tetraacyldisaccharide 4'-kinase
MARLRARVQRSWDDAVPGSGLTALSALYGGLVRGRERLHRGGVLQARSVPAVVISIGNLTVGGTGKTPAVEGAALTLLELGARPAIVSRGYGRSTRGIQVVSDGRAARLGSRDAGDEPYLLARRLLGVPIVVGANRHEAAQYAVSRFGVSCVLLDDGFQHRSLRKDVEIVLARAHRPWGNGRLLPAGPLREPLSALARADLIVATGAEHPADADAVAGAVARYAPGVPVACAAHEGIMPVDTDLRGRRLLAFAGIAAPERFRRTLQTLGVEVVGLRSFPDHHWYRARDMSSLDAAARAAGAEGLVTTEKDAVRLDRLAPALPLHVVPVRFQLLTGEAVWRSLLARALS